MTAQQSAGSPSRLQEKQESPPAFPFPENLDWFYVLRRLSRRQLVAARTFVRHVERMEQAMQPLIRAQKRAHFAARKTRRHAERQTARHEEP